MKKIRKATGTVIILALLLSTLSITSLASNQSDFVVENGVLTEYTGTDANVVIPRDLGITEIGTYAFVHKNTMVSVVIPEGVQVIGISAFQNSNNLTAVQLPSTVTEIGASAFCFCNSLMDIQLPSDLTYLGGIAFEGCESLRCLVIPDGVTMLRMGTFGNCPNLSQLYIPSSVCYISNEVFIGDIGDGVGGDNTDPVVYVEKNSFAESAMKALAKNYTVFGESDQRVDVTPKIISILVDNSPIEFTAVNIDGSYYINAFDFTEAINSSTSNYHVSLSPYSGNVSANSQLLLHIVTEESASDGVGYGETLETKPDGTSVSAMPIDLLFWSSGNTSAKGYVINNGLFVKIRDIAQEVGFEVSWDSGKSMVVINT